MNTTFIYALLDPIEKQGFHIYVGKSDNPYKRYYEHLKDKSNTYKTRWIRLLTINYLNPNLQILEIVDKSIWEQKEIEWIKFYKDHNYKVLNETEGGDKPPSKLGFIHSINTKIKISETHKGKKFSQDHKNKISNSLKGRHLSEESKQKIRNFNIGKHKSEETKRKLQISRQGKKPNLGKHTSEETKMKISNSLKEYYHQS
jgi:hypothetical protein